MAEGSGSSDSPVYTFDLVDGTFVNEGETIMAQLNDEEKEEVESILHIIRATQDADESTNRHKPIDSAELDGLAMKNNAESTGYQTKWALTVFQGEKSFFYSFIT